MASKLNWRALSTLEGDSGMKRGRQGLRTIFRGWVIVVLGVLLAACGGDEEEAAGVDAGQVTTPSGTNRLPTITGVPPTSITAGMVYAFTPTASDADGDTLTFGVTNLPAWASFNTTTGRLSGTPAAQNVGTTTGIVITANDGHQGTTSLAAFNLTVQAVGVGSATLSWLPPTANTDGSPLTNLAGYKVYWGLSQGNYPNSVTLANPGLASYVVSNLSPGTYFFVVTAYNADGTESSFSSAASKTIQ